MTTQMMTKQMNQVKSKVKKKKDSKLDFQLVLGSPSPWTQEDLDKAIDTDNIFPLTQITKTGFFLTHTFFPLLLSIDEAESVPIESATNEDESMDEGAHNPPLPSFPFQPS